MKTLFHINHDKGEVWFRWKPASWKVAWRLAMFVERALVPTWEIAHCRISRKGPGGGKRATLTLILRPKARNIPLWSSDATATIYGNLTRDFAIEEALENFQRENPLPA
jgi:hypothetical protein